MGQYWAPKPRPVSKRSLEGDGDEGEKDEGEKDEGEKGEGENGEEKGCDGKEESNGEIPTDPEQDIPATQPDPEYYPSPAESRTLECSMFAPLRTPKKGAGDVDGERMDSKLAWTLGGELLPTLGLHSPWADSLPSMEHDSELAQLEAELAKTETLISKFNLPIINKFCF